MKLKLVTYPNPLLREISAPVEEFNSEISDLAYAMLDSLQAFRGVGLSAVQIGKLIRLFVVNTNVPGEKGIFINPQIVETSQDNVAFDEGCLSVPSCFASIMRPSEVTIQAYDVKGKPFTVHATGLYARALQHESDHLDGKLYIDHMNKKSLNKLLKEYRKLHGNGIEKK